MIGWRVFRAGSYVTLPKMFQLCVICHLWIDWGVHLLAACNFLIGRYSCTQCCGVADVSPVRDAESCKHRACVLHLPWPPLHPPPTGGLLPRCSSASMKRPSCEPWLLHLVQHSWLWHHSCNSPWNQAGLMAVLQSCSWLRPSQIMSTSEVPSICFLQTSVADKLKKNYCWLLKKLP